MTQKRYHYDYVRLFTNAPFLVSERSPGGGQAIHRKADLGIVEKAGEPRVDARQRQEDDRDNKDGENRLGDRVGDQRRRSARRPIPLPQVIALAASSLVPLSLAFGLVPPHWIVTLPSLSNRWARSG